MHRKVEGSEFLISLAVNISFLQRRNFYNWICSTGDNLQHPNSQTLHLKMLVLIVKARRWSPQSRSFIS